MKHDQRYRSIAISHYRHKDRSSQEKVTVGTCVGGSSRDPIRGAGSESISSSVVFVFDSLRPRGLKLARLLCPWNSPGKNTRVDCHSLFQGFFPTWGSNPGFPHCRWIPYHLSHGGSDMPKSKFNAWVKLLVFVAERGHRLKISHLW